LHGPPGTGKTHLVSALLAEVTRRCPDQVVTALPAGDLTHEDRGSQTEDRGPRIEDRKTAPSGPSSILDPRSSVLADSDLLRIADREHRPPRAAGPLAALLDGRQARQQQVVLTACVGPAQLAHRGERFPARLTSRLAGGLVVGLAPLDADGRLALLEERAKER